MRAAVCRVLAALGMVPVAPMLPAPALPAHLSVQLDGRVVGHVKAGLAGAMVAHLRAIKAANLAAEEQLTPGGLWGGGLGGSSWGAGPTHACRVVCWRPAAAPCARRPVPPQADAS